MVKVILCLIALHLFVTGLPDWSQAQIPPPVNNYVKKYTHLYCDAQGNTKIETGSTTFSMMTVAAGAPMLGVSNTAWNASKVEIMVLPAQWNGGHPHKPGSNLMLVILSGKTEASVPGTTSVTGPGDIILVEDVGNCPGHTSKVLGKDPAYMLGVSLSKKQTASLLPRLRASR